VLAGKSIEHRVLRYPGLFAGFSTAADNGPPRDTGFPAATTFGRNVMNWIETYAPPNPPQEETP
jgi:hypothetical protein